MAQKVTGIIKLQIPAAKATASPPVGPALGQHGVNIAAFIKEFNARTQDQAGNAFPHIDPQSPLAVSLHRCHGEIPFLPIPQDGENQGALASV